MKKLKDGTKIEASRWGVRVAESALLAAGVGAAIASMYGVFGHLSAAQTWSKVAAVLAAISSGFSVLVLVVTSAGARARQRAEDEDNEAQMGRVRAEARAAARRELAAALGQLTASLKDDDRNDRAA